MRLYSRLKNHIENFTNISKNGVYRIYHIDKPHLSYIGSTCRKHIKYCKKGCYGRWIEHFTLLNKNKHHSKYLQNVVNKYGISGIRFELLLNMEEKSQREIREQELLYINKFNSYKKGYNSSETPIIVNMSEKSKKESSERMKIKNPMSNPDIVKKMLKTKESFYINYILQYDLKGNFVKKYKNTTEASKILNVDSSNIFRALQFKKSFKCVNSLWFYEKDFNYELLEKRIYIINQPQKRSEEQKQRKLNIGNKPVLCIDLNTLEEFKFKSIKECSEILKINAGNISKCCNGIYKKCKNFKISFNK